MAKQRPRQAPKPAPKPAPKSSLHTAILDYALGFPESHEDHPWGETVVKVRKKVFVFLGSGDGPHALSMSVKLPESLDEALGGPYGKPTSHGLGKSGWVTITLERAGGLPLEQLHAWIEESFRAIAPKKVIAQLDAQRDA